MINLINEEELFNLSLSTGYEDSLLPKHEDHFKERIGIKMVSEDGTNFLQGLASLDILEVNNEIKLGNKFIWVNPVCKNTNFIDILKLHIDLESNKYIESKYLKKEVEKDMSKIKNKRKNKKALEKKFKKENKNNINIIKEETKENITQCSVPEDEKSIGKGKCNHILHQNNEKLIEDFSKVMNAPINISFISNDDEINKIIKEINNPLAELPALMKSHITLLASFEKDEKDNVIGFACADTYNVSKSVGIKLLNIYVDEKYYNNGIATKLVKDLEKKSIEYVKTNKDTYPHDNITFIANAVGKNKEYVAKILEKLNYIKDGESRGRISFIKELTA